MTLVLSIPAETLSRTLVSSRAISQSPFSLSYSQQLWGGHRWEYTINTSMLDLGSSLAKRLSAQLNQLSSRGEIFMLADPTCYQPSFVGFSPVVSEQAMAGSSVLKVALSGAPSFSIGDFLSVPRLDGLQALHQIVGAENPALGVQELSIVPPLRQTANLGAAILAAQPLVTLAMTQGAAPQSFSSPFLVKYTLAALEAF